MAFFKPWGDNEDSLTNQLLQLSQWYSGQVEEKQRKTAGMYDEFDDATKSFSNEETLECESCHYTCNHCKVI